MTQGAVTCCYLLDSSLLFSYVLFSSFLIFCCVLAFISSGQVVEVR